MSTKPKPIRAMLQVHPRTHERVCREARRSNLPVHAVATMLLDHALDAVKSQSLKINPPGLETP
jgi:hypothetical protein